VTYLCIVRWAPGRLDGLSGSEYAALMDETAACDVELRRGGHLLAGWTVAPPCAATLVRRRGGHAVAEPGPAGDVAAALLLAARDLNAAVAVAARLPMARLGTVEVYAVQGDAEGPA
jgi:hypothetical protein